MVIEVVRSKFDTREVLDTKLTELEISEPQSDFSEPEFPSDVIYPTLAPHSPKVKLIITNNLPLGLISIKDITIDEEEETPSTPVFTDEQTISPDLTFSSFQPNLWYFITLNFLGQGIPHYLTHYYSVLRFNMSGMIY